ncbi:DUF4838 domain-containing protein [Chitinophaga sp. MM2321]|uniref:DUF4838 domain-containing protein n=1 Tax=Chitinophaga sp. MM2321 TaxID=3137178 RepID=UPI0032D5B091
MKSLFLVVCLFATSSLWGNPPGKLITEGKSDYKIFVSESASDPEQRAARELQKYLQKVSGCFMEITHETKPDAKLIYIGFTGAPETLLKNLQPKEFGKEEYIIRSDGDQLLIAGGAPRGTLYGVIGYLSDYLDCRWYTREVIKTPKQTTITLSQIEDRQKPVFVNREAWYREAYNPEWAMHNRLNPTIVPLPDSMGGSYIAYPFAHTFSQLVPSEKHFSTHPEYFAEVNGKRLNGPNPQLCLTNPAVVKIATAQVFEWIKEHPEANIFSIDQNDGEGNCTCKDCKKIDDAEGSPSGSLLTFVNQIADTVGKVYPAVNLRTFAYAYTEVPPRNIRPADNVTIRLCHYQYCSAHPLTGCDDHKPFIERFNAWKKIAKHISIWDYYTDFAQFLMPFPNFESFKHDIKWYADHGVESIFAQGNNVPDNGGGEFSELRAWVISQLLWNANRDPQALVDEYVNNVYGDAAPFISGYIKLLHDEVKKDNLHFSIWLRPEEVKYLSVPVMQKADSLFGQALKAAAGDTDLINRVELAYLPVLYIKLYFYSTGGTAYLNKKEVPYTFDRFKKIIARHQIKATSEDEKSYGGLAGFMKNVESSATFYTDWWLIGPFNDTDSKGLQTSFLPENSLDIRKVYPGNGSKTTWIKHENKASGYIDFTSIFTPTEKVVAYAQRTITTATAKPMKFGVGSNDGVRVWINGKLVLDRPVARKAKPNEDIIDVNLKKGENTILVKVNQLKGGWGFYFAEL